MPSWADTADPGRDFGFPEYTAPPADPSAELDGRVLLWRLRLIAWIGHICSHLGLKENPTFHLACLGRWININTEL